MGAEQCPRLSQSSFNPHCERVRATHHAPRGPCYLREAVTTLEDGERIARRVFGGAHPITMGIEEALRNARAALRARETPPAGDK